MVSKTGKSGTLSTGGHAKDMLRVAEPAQVAFQGFS